MKNKYTQALKGKAGTLLILTASLLSFEVHSSDLRNDAFESTRVQYARRHNEIALKYGFHDRLLDIDAIKESEKKPRNNGSTVEFREAAKKLRQQAEAENTQMEKGKALVKQALKDKLVEGDLKPETKESLFEYLLSCFRISYSD